MPRRQKDRAVEVVEVFESLPLAAAQQLLVFARETVRRREVAEGARSGQAHAPTPVKRRTTKPTVKVPTATAGPTEH